SGVTLPAHRFLVTRLAERHQFVLGYDFLYEHHLVVDPRNEKLVFSPYPSGSAPGLSSVATQSVPVPESPSLLPSSQSTYLSRPSWLDPSHRVMMSSATILSGLSPSSLDEVLSPQADLPPAGFLRGLLNGQNLTRYISSSSAASVHCSSAAPIVAPDSHHLVSARDFFDHGPD
ncbi:hypothetical protein OIO90_006656, partial [Microbotryomycetes sp. JL221]